jgi:tetratricopeptide (TPR) repeat protein
MWDMRPVALIVSALLLSSCARSGQSRLGEAIVLSNKGQTEAAVAVLEAQLAREPGGIRERRLVIRLYGTLGRLDKARAHADALGRRLGAASPVAAIELGHALELAHEYEQALSLYDTAAELAPADPSGPRTGGMRAAAWGELQLAEPRLSEATRRDPSDASSWHALGVVRVKQGNLSGGERAYREGLARDPKSVENRVGLATIALLRGDAQKVLQEYEALLQVRPEFVDAHLGRSWALVRLGRFDEANAALSRAEELGADRRSLARQRGWLAAEQAKSAGTP